MSLLLYFLEWFRRKIAPLLTPGIISLVQKMLEPNFKARVTIDDIVTDKYFKEHNLEMTETEKMALTYATKHKTSLQTTKKVNLSDMAIYTEENEAYTSTVAVTQQIMDSTPHVPPVEHRASHDKEHLKSPAEEHTAPPTVTITGMHTDTEESPTKSPVREATLAREPPDDNLTTIANGP